MKKFKFINNTKVNIPKSSYPKIDSVIDDSDPDDVYKDFFDFGNGVYISNEHKQSWINEVMDYFNKNEDGGDFCYTGSGRCMVIGLKCGDEIEILVVDKYMSATVRLD